MIRSGATSTASTEEDDEELAHHMQGLSPSEQATFKRYMLALQNGDTLEDELSVIPAVQVNESALPAPLPHVAGPPVVKAAAKPAAAQAVVEKSVRIDGATPTAGSSAASQISEKAEGIAQPKRVSRFRAAKS